MSFITSFILLHSLIDQSVFVLISLFQGALIATMLAYVMPSLCTIIIYTRVSRERKLKKIILSSLVCLIGLTVAISGLVSIFHKVKEGYTCSHGKEPSYCYSTSNTVIGLNQTTTQRYLNATV